MQFNEKLKKLRSEKGISQSALAEKIFVSRSAVAKWENGLGLPSEQSLSMLADFFGVEVSELLSDPLGEKVIVNKNTTISSQKIWIISILIFSVTVAIVLISLCCYLATRSAPSVTPIITRHLIFETEKDIDTEWITAYPDDEISADSVFIDSRVFEIKPSVGAIRLPNLLVKTTVNGNVSYETVEPSRVIFSVSDNIILRYEREQDGSVYISVLPIDYYAIEFCEWANIKYGDLIISIKVFRNHIAVEKVTLGFDDRSSEIGLTQRKLLACDIKPYNANYTNYSYRIDSIIRPDGEKYEGDFTQYAYIDGHYLYVTKDIAIGSKIYLFAITEYDKVKSNIFEVTVTH